MEYSYVYFTTDIKMFDTNAHSDYNDSYYSPNVEGVDKHICMMGKKRATHRLKVFTSKKQLSMNASSILRLPFVASEN